jgi:hypothetical protein
VRFQRLRFIAIPAVLLLTIALSATEAAAQRRGGVVARQPARPIGRQLVIRGGFYGPVFFNPWYTYGYYGYPGYGDGFGYQYGYPPYGYYGRADLLSASVRLEVTPKETEVYVDGFRAGAVDDFDGFFQRLRMRPGEHDLVLYHDGFRTVHQHLYMNSGADQKIRYTMVPLSPGEQAEARPQPPPPVMANGEPGQPGNQPPMRPRGFGPGRGGPPPMRPQPPEGPGAPDARFGSVSIRVQPGDAEVLIDGERWSGSNSQDRLVVQLPEGRHHVDVRKNGFENYSSDVDVTSGQSVTLNVSLSRRSN